MDGRLESSASHGNALDLKSESTGHSEPLHQDILQVCSIGMMELAQLAYPAG
jgi:hypothetical protein